MAGLLSVVVLFCLLVHHDGEMYGLIVENVLGYLRTHYHPHRYEEIKASAKLNFDDPIDLFKVYPEGVIPRIGKKASMHLQVTQKKEKKSDTSNFPAPNPTPPSFTASNFQ